MSSAIKFVIFLNSNHLWFTDMQTMIILLLGAMALAQFATGTPIRK